MRTSVGFILENTWCSQDVLAHEVLVKLGVPLFHHILVLVEILVAVFFRVVHGPFWVFLSEGFSCVRHSDAGSAIDQHVRVGGLGLDALKLSPSRSSANKVVHFVLKYYNIY